MGERKGPPESATAHPVGTRKKGNDGRMWSVKETQSGVRRWVPTSSAAGEPRRLRAPREHHLLFCEPYSHPLRGVKLRVPDSLYTAILRSPKKYRRARGDSPGNAYIFGPRYPLDSYARVGSHGNDGAQTGFIDLDLYKRGPTVQGGLTDAVIKAFTVNRKLLNWDDRAALRRLRKEAPYILFLGETVGGDVGATLYVHKTRGRVDSILIENNYFYPD